MAIRLTRTAGCAGLAFGGLVAFCVPSLPEFPTCTQPEIALQVSETPQLLVNTDRALWPAQATVQLGGCPGDLMARTNGPGASVNASCGEGAVPIGLQPAVICRRLLPADASPLALQIVAPLATPPVITLAVQQRHDNHSA